MNKNPTIIADTSGRLDKVLSNALHQSRNQIGKLIKNGQVAINGDVVVKPSVVVSVGDEIGYEFVEAPIRDGMDVDFDIEVLYEDDDIMVVNKPAGLVVHPAPSVQSATLVDWLIQRGVSLSTISGEERHGIVHRIDKDTTGALAIAKNNHAHIELSRQLQDKSMGRYYLAITDLPLKSSMTVEAPIARNPKNRLKMGIVEGGRASKTQFVQLAESSRGEALVAAKLFTGRTHQIRVHLGALGRHILGDSLYGFKTKEGKITRIYLHAYMLYLTHPVTGLKLEIMAPLFDDMSRYIIDNFDKERIDEAILPSELHGRFECDIFTKRMW